MMLLDSLQRLLRREDLSFAEAQTAMTEILTQENIPQTAAFFALLRAKKETAAEISGIAQVMQNAMLKVSLDIPVLDIVGTGGDGVGTINISTGAALIAASCGVKVAKHGNRAVSSRCGAADVLEALGVNIALSPEAVANCVRTVGIGFCFAPLFHPAFQKLKPLRLALGFPTVMNIMGPLLNPASAGFRLIGVYQASLLDLIADALMTLKVNRAMVCFGENLDELSTVGSATVVEIQNGTKTKYELDPQQYGFARCSVSDLTGGTPVENAEILKKALLGKDGPVLDTLLFNAGVACYLYGIVDSIEAGIVLAKKQVVSGAVMQKLEDLKAWSNHRRYK